MSSSKLGFVVRLCAAVALIAALTAPSDAQVANSASLSLSPSPSVTVVPSGTASFDVLLGGYTGTDPIIGFSLDFTGSDPALTGGGTFSGFGFTRSTALDGILSMEFPSLPGQWSFGADIFGGEAGITPAMAASGIDLGTLSVVAPMTDGLYPVTLTVGLGQTYLQLDNADLTTIPPDGTLDVVNSAIQVNGPAVVPEPASIIIWSLLGAGSWLGMNFWRRRRGAASVEGVSIPTGPPVRRPWSDEDRRAIHDIIARGVSR